MNSYRPNNRRKTPGFLGALMVAILLSVLLFAIDTLSGGLVRSYARTMASLGWSAASGTLSGIDASGVFRSHRSLVAENNALREQAALREEGDARFAALVRDNEILREMARVAESEGVGLTARVLSSFDTSPYGTFLIGAGRNDGVTAGSVVLTPGGFVLGTVTDLDANTATVAALFSPTESVELSVGDVAFTAYGRGSGNAKGEVPREAAITRGDAAIVPKYGRVAGVIGSIVFASSSATQTLYVRLPVNLDSLTYVYVIPR